jgi:hypothetical protein
MEIPKENMTTITMNMKWINWILYISVKNLFFECYIKNQKKNVYEFFNH